MSFFQFILQKAFLSNFFFRPQQISVDLLPSLESFLLHHFLTKFDPPYWPSQATCAND